MRGVTTELEVGRAVPASPSFETGVGFKLHGWKGKGIPGTRIVGR